MNPPIEPDASAPSEDALNDLLGRLAPLYHDGEGDRPDNVLADHPDTASVIKALKLPVDVIKPGRFYQGDIGRIHGVSGVRLKNIICCQGNLS